MKTRLALGLATLTVSTGLFLGQEAYERGKSGNEPRTVSRTIYRNEGKTIGELLRKTDRNVILLSNTFPPLEVLPLLGWGCASFGGPFMSTLTASGYIRALSLVLSLFVSAVLAQTADLQIVLFHVGQTDAAGVDFRTEN